MEQNKFKEIIQFAIEKEIASADFYKKASQAARHSGTKELFLDFAREEQGHRKLLEDFNAQKIAKVSVESIPDLKISEYLIDAELKPDISYAEILRLAMKREEHSIRLYTDLAEPAKDGELRKLFRFLIQEETKHKYRIEKIYDDEILK
jgi:rubrerythrin